MNQTLVVVADNGRARIYAMGNKVKPMIELADLIHAEARMHENELISDRKGRTHDSKGAARHAKEYHTTIKKQQAQKFARDICAFIEKERKKHTFNQLALVAPPGFLGILRKSLGRESVKLIAREIDKDMVLLQEHVIREHLAA